MPEWKEVFVTSDEMEAEMIKDILESGGITVVMRSSKISPYPVSIGRMGEIRLLVNGKDESMAKELIASFSGADR